MSTGITTVLALVSIVIWITVSSELSKASKENNNEQSRGKLITLMSAGTLSTIFVAFSLYQNIQL
jgi:hypothetical protein